MPAGLGHPCNAAMDNCVSEVLIRQVAHAIVERGLKSAGYQYVNLSAPPPPHPAAAPHPSRTPLTLVRRRDDCWMAKSRDKDGKLQPDPIRFPSGMANLSAYVHSKGLKIGICTCTASRIGSAVR